MAISSLFSFLLWLPFTCSHALVLVGDKCTTSVQGISLRRHNYKSFSVQDMFICYNKCKGDTLCQSLNFHRDRHLCEFNNRTKSVAAQVDLARNTNAFYLENPYRAFLGSSPLQPAVSCREIKDSSEGLAPNGRYWLISRVLGEQPFAAYCDMKNAVVVECTGSPCKNGGTCDYQGEERYTCRCIPGYKGTHCEFDVDECSSNPCLNGGTCTDMLNGYTCACGAYFTGTRCELGPGPECSSYNVDKQTDRSVTHATVDLSYKCDSALVTGWYRFNSTAGSKMPTYCVTENMCNTHATGWLNGAHPTLQDGVVSRDVCFNWSGNCCNWQVSISVKNCGLFYVYKLVKSPNCELRYCVTK